jgi:hypothetical protein
MTDEEIEVLKNTIIHQREYIQELKDVLDSYEDIIKEHIAIRRAEMKLNKDLWQKYIDGELQ